MDEDNKNTELNDIDEKLDISGVSSSFNKNDLFEAFSHYAFVSISNRPYSEKELIEEFEKWFSHKFQNKNT